MAQPESGRPKQNVEGYYKEMAGMCIVSHGDLLVYVPRLNELEIADGQDQIASAAYDRILRVWDVESQKQIRTFSGHTQSTLAVDYDNTGKLLASG
jgi:WD40 repeat protein